MPLRIGRFFAAAFVSVLLTAAANAGPLIHDPAAALTGSQAFSGTVGFFSINATVEYAVYAPGTFSTSDAAHLNFPADFSAGSEYIYAYEVFNTGAGFSNKNITSLSVGLFPGGVSNNAVLIGNVADPQSPGVSPVQFNFNPAAAGSPKSSAFWNFSSTPGQQLATGLHSDILIFASPNPWSFKISSMLGGSATAASALLPSPVPEPATFALAIMAAFGLVGFRFLRRRLY